jgi:hypothetical protein
MPGLTYTTYKTQIAQMAVVAEDDVNFLTILPMMIDYASLRICRDLDLMFTSVSLHGAAYQLTTGNRNLSFPQNLSDGTSFVVSEQINLILNATVSNDPDTGTRYPLMPTTKEFLDAVYGSAVTTNRGQPKYFVPFNETLFFVGPTPNTNYAVEVVGTIRPAPLGYMPNVSSASVTGSTGTINFSSTQPLTAGSTVTLRGFVPTYWNGTFTVATATTSSMTVTLPTSVGVATPATTIGYAINPASVTFISQYLPDLLVMASMIYISAYQRNFGKESDDPQMAMSYETQYQLLLKSAVVEEARKKFDAAGWSSQSPATVASPTRG